MGHPTPRVTKDALGCEHHGGFNSRLAGIFGEAVRRGLHQLHPGRLSVCVTRKEIIDEGTAH